MHATVKAQVTTGKGSHMFDSQGSVLRDHLPSDLPRVTDDRK